MPRYSLEDFDAQLRIFNSIKEDYLYNFSLTLNKVLIGPVMLQLILTTKCNLKCAMCGVWKQQEEEAETFYVKKSIDDTYKLGNLQEVYFTGGEVLLRPDIFTLIKYVKDYYPEVKTHLNTNGLVLNKQTIDRLISLEPTHLGISIDSPDPKIHNSLRGEGVFEKVIEAIDYINVEKKKRNKKFPLINTLSVMMDQTLDTMYDMVDFSIAHNFSDIHIQPYVCNSDLRGKKENKFWIKQERLPLLRDVLDRIEAMKNNCPLYIGIASDKIYEYFSNSTYVDKCYAGFTRALVVGKKICFICNGPNSEREQHFGMADKDSIDKVWFSEKAQFFRNTIKACGNNCVQFCSIRPSSDSARDIHERLVKNNNLFLMFREIDFLKECLHKHPALELGGIIDSAFRYLLENLKEFIAALENIRPEECSGETRAYLFADLRLLDDYIFSRLKQANSSSVCTESDNNSAGKISFNDEIELYKTRLKNHLSVVSGIKG